MRSDRSVVVNVDQIGVAFLRILLQQTPEAQSRQFLFSYIKGGLECKNYIISCTG